MTIRKNRCVENLLQQSNSAHFTARTCEETSQIKSEEMFSFLLKDNLTKHFEDNE